MLKVEYDTKGPTMIIKFIGELGYSDIELIREEITKKTKDKNIKNLIVDLSDTTVLDSAGISLLITLFKRTADKGGKFSIANPSDVVRRTLEICNLHKVFRTYHSVSEALENV